MLFFFSILCTFVQAKPHANPQKHRHENRAAASSVTTNVGIVYDGTSNLGAFSGKIGFSVDWSPTPLSSSNGLSLGEFIPQLWTFQDSNHLNPWNWAAPSWPSGVKLIGFNEPDIPGQSWMLPSTAISGWDNVAKYQSSKGALVATPGVSNAAVSLGTISGVANPGGIAWTSQFLALAESHSPKYTFQAISMHWYGSSQLTVEGNGNMFTAQAGAMIQLANAHGIPEVWITEMGSGYDASAATKECQFLQWLEGTFMKNASNSKITKYAYNQHMGTLLNGNSLTHSGSALLGGTGAC